MWRSLKNSFLLKNTSVSKYGPSSFLQSVRSMFIQTFDTPNPNSLKFIPGEKVLGRSGTVDFPDISSSSKSPLARHLFSIEGVQGVMFGDTWVTVRKDDDTEWKIVKPQVFATLMDFYSSNLPVMREDVQAMENNLDEDLDDVSLMVIELLETRIRPSVQEDGGDIEFVKFEDGIVHLKLQGACTGCPSSSVTLKAGIENMLKHYIPEVMSVEQFVDEKQRIEDDEFAKVEMNIKRKGIDDKSSSTS